MFWYTKYIDNKNIQVFKKILFECVTQLDLTKFSPMKRLLLLFWVGVSACKVKVKEIKQLLLNSDS